MGYTPTTWTTGDTVTASALNKIENGIANAGSGSLIACNIWIPNSTLGHQVYGDFNSALALVQQGIPICCCYFDNFNSGSYGFDTSGPQFLGASYSNDYPNQIDFLFTAGIGLRWTANGVSYFD